MRFPIIHSPTLAASLLLVVVEAQSAEELPGDENVGGKAITKGHQADLGSFAWLVIQDLVYTLRSAPEPVNDKESIREWNQLVDTKLSYLRVLTAEENVDPHIRSAIEELQKFTIKYSAFRDYMEVVKIAKDIRMLEGTPTWRSHLADGLPTLSAATSALVNPMKLGEAIAEGAAAGLKKWDEKFIRASLMSKVDQSNQSELEKRLSQQMLEYRSCDEWLIEHCSKMGVKRGSGLPSFCFLTGDAIATNGEECFDLQAKAAALVEARPGEGADLMVKAAHRLPNLPDQLGRYVSHFLRVPLLLQAVEAYKFEAHASASPSQDAPKRMLSALREVLQCSHADVGSLPYPALLSYSWALAQAELADSDESVKVLSALKSFWAQPGFDDLTRALHFYDEAVVFSTFHQNDKALSALRRSYEIVPRRDPMTLVDTNLRLLLASHSAVIKDLVDHQLTGGRWEWASTGSQYVFYPGGILRQLYKGSIYSGEWSMNGQSLTLSNRTPQSRALDDTTYPITGDCVSTMFMQATQGVIPLTRTGRSILSSADSDFNHKKLDESGRWQWSDGRPCRFSRFATIEFPDVKDKIQFWFLYEHPTKGRISFTQFTKS
jgi:hypothetical protein